VLAGGCIFVSQSAGEHDLHWPLIYPARQTDVSE